MMMSYRLCLFVDLANLSTIEFPPMMVSVRLCRFVADVDFDAVDLNNDVVGSCAEPSGYVCLDEVFLWFCIYATVYNYWI